MTLQAIKDALYLAIDHAREHIIQIGETVANNPEIGYREEETSALARKVLGALSIPNEYPLAKTGVKGTLKGKSGCIAGLHEILHRQGLMQNIGCLNPKATLSPGQAAELDRVSAAYPHLSDDVFIRENIEKWKADCES